MAINYFTEKNHPPRFKKHNSWESYISYLAISSDKTTPSRHKSLLLYMVFLSQFSAHISLHIHERKQKKNCQFPPIAHMCVVVYRTYDDDV